jgi:hypothetical protein
MLRHAQTNGPDSCNIDAHGQRLQYVFEPGSGPALALWVCAAYEKAVTAFDIATVQETQIRAIAQVTHRSDHQRHDCYVGVNGIPGEIVA